MDSERNECDIDNPDLPEKTVNSDKITEDTAFEQEVREKMKFLSIKRDIMRGFFNIQYLLAKYYDEKDPFFTEVDVKSLIIQAFKEIEDKIHVSDLRYEIITFLTSNEDLQGDLYQALDTAKESNEIAILSRVINSIHRLKMDRIRFLKGAGLYNETLLKKAIKEIGGDSNVEAIEDTGGIKALISQGDVLEKRFEKC